MRAKTTPLSWPRLSCKDHKPIPPVAKRAVGATAMTTTRLHLKTLAALVSKAAH